MVTANKTADFYKKVFLKDFLSENFFGIRDISHSFSKVCRFIVSIKII